MLSIVVKSSEVCGKHEMLLQRVQPRVMQGPKCVPGNTSMADAA